MKISKIIKIFLFLMIFSLIVAAESPDNQPPEAYFIASPSSGQSPLTVQFDASGSIDRDGSIVSYTWDFGDGKSGAGDKVAYTYRNFGSFTASLKVTDNSGQTGIYTTKITVTSGKSLLLTIIPDPITVSPGEPSLIRVSVTDKEGNPMAAVAVALKSNMGGKLDPGSGKTDSSGKFSSGFTAPEGKYTISATATKTGISQGSGETTVRVSIQKPLFMDISSTPGSIGPGGKSNIRVKVKGSDGAPVNDALVTLIPDNYGSIVPESGRTDSGGQFTATFTGQGEVSHSVKAIVIKPGYAKASGEINIAFSPGNNVLFIVLLIIIILIGSAFQEFWIKGKLQLIPLKTDVQSDGASSIPVKVQFVDLSGKPKTQVKDRSVKIISSSGAVMDVVVQKGKEAVETVLASSVVCGTVKLTGRSGLQKSAASVNFAGNVAGIVLDVSPTKIPADGISISSVIVKIKDNKENFIASLDGWVVEMSTTLGTITNPVNILPGTLSGIAILTSGNKTGTATVTAAMGTLRSEKKVVFEELPERYCMHCGDPMKRDMKSCPNCKKTPPSNAEIKECYSCNSVIPASAGFCDRCGAKQPV